MTTIKKLACGLLVVAVVSTVALVKYYVHARESAQERHEVTWTYAYECTKHGFDGAMELTETYGKDGLTPDWDTAKGATDWLYPAVLPAALSMYEITRDEGYLDYARSCADSVRRNMLNDKNIVRIYSRSGGASDTEATDLNYRLLPVLADLAIYDSSYRSLAESVAEGVVVYGLSQCDIPYELIYPSGAVADREASLPSNNGTISITITGLLRVYEATGNPLFLSKAHDILMSIWENKKTAFGLIPTTFNADTLETIEPNTQLYATGELLKAYIYYYFLTHDQEIRDIVSEYSAAAYDLYWDTTTSGKGYFVYRVDVDTGKQFARLLETNWHKLDMSLIYADEVTGNDYTERVYEDMNTYWLGAGVAYKHRLFRHITKRNGLPGSFSQDLIYASMRTADYVMLRMLNSGAFAPSDATWNDKVWKHIDTVRRLHYQEYGYDGDVHVTTLRPDAGYYGLGVEPACGEFASLVTLMFSTTPNVRMVWELFPLGDSALEPFTTDYTAQSLGFMTGVFMDYSHKEVAFRTVRSEGQGEVYCSDTIAEVREDGKIYANWHDNVLEVSDGGHEYVVVFEGGSYVTPVYADKGVGQGG